jgi:hypothetical protein
MPYFLIPPSTSPLSPPTIAFLGALLVSDVKDGHVKHEVKLDRSEMRQQITPKILLPSFGQIICDFGHELRIVRFPLHDKNE